MASEHFEDHFLPPGPYIIYSKGAKAHAGRLDEEDKSLLPKDIVTLPDGLPGQFFKLESSDHMGKYLIKAPGDKYTSVVANPDGSDGRLVAVLSDEPAPIEWFVIPQGHLGEDVFTVTHRNDDHDRGEAWFANEAGKPVQLKPLEPREGYDHSRPFDDEELWKITPVQVEGL